MSRFNREGRGVIASLDSTSVRHPFIKGGLGQCIAAMLAAQIFNEQAGNQIERIYGAVTSGTVWKFMALQDKTVYIDSAEYYISQVDKILGILLQAIKQSDRSIE